MAGVTAAFAAVGVATGIGAAVKEAMLFEAALQQINRLMGSSAKEFQNWANESASAFSMSRSEAVRYGAVYANLLSTFSSGTADTMRKTQDLLKASAVIASSTGRDMGDVMERIRSGLLGNTEAIEDLGINVYVNLLESTKAFKEFANGKSWDQLDFNTQQTIRYFAILEQAATKYGLELAQNTTSRQAAFTAQLKDAQLALGQAFLPIYNAVLPALTRMAAALANAMRWVAAFSNALFGYKNETKSTEAQTAAVGGLGDAYEEAGKQAKKAQKSVAGFDQVNLVGGKSGDAGGGSGGSAGAGSSVGGAASAAINGGLIGATDEAASKADEMAKRFRGAIQDVVADFKRAAGLIKTALGPALQGAWNTIQPALTKWKDFFRTTFEQIVILGEPLKKWVITGLVPLWQQGIGVAGEVMARFLDSGVMQATSFRDAMVPIFSWFVTDGLPLLTEFTSGALDVFNQLHATTKAVFDDIWMGIITPALNMMSKIVVDVLNAIKGFWDTWGKRIVDSIKGYLQSVREIWDAFFNVYLKPFVTKILGTLSELWDKHLKGLVTEIGNFVGKLITAAADIFNKFIKPIMVFLIEKLGPTFTDIMTMIVDRIGSAVGGIVDFAKGIIKALGGVVEFIAGVFTGDWKRAWNGIKDFMGGIGDAIVGVFKGAVNMIIDTFNFMIRQLNKVKIEVPEANIPGIGKVGGGTIGINIPEIPKLAKGGLAYGPTLAMVGDNKGAAANPEVIAPLSELQAMINNSNDNRDVVSVLRQILRAVELSGPSDQATISKSDLARAALAGQNDLTRRAGRTLAIT
ncbi:phage tail protein [Cohnella cholangitidis]|uniref:Phage-related protein n=1 Tax=Cohnella cholangitidis TaxID=2598458 RepID=A0A7G5C5I6_9BACL|nr:hypothetical protein [Cohnella cholangitidis]QMV44470.1 hypothetical protein FPL14_27350 [Cohnella cholangitidis]